jgi:hypothetical protein
MFEENYPKQDYFYVARPNMTTNQSLTSTPGEIYSIISGMVDQKFAERHIKNE